VADTNERIVVVTYKTELAFVQFDMEYEVEATNGRTKKADRLKLNLYLDVKRRAMTLLRLHLELENQRNELAELLQNKARLEFPAGIEAEDRGEQECGPPEMLGGGRLDRTSAHTVRQSYTRLIRQAHMEDET